MTKNLIGLLGVAALLSAAAVHAQKIGPADIGGTVSGPNDPRRHAVP